MDCPLPEESVPEIDFDNARKDVDKKSNCSKIDYSECNLTDLFNFSDITAYKDSSDLDDKTNSESNNKRQ